MNKKLVVILTALAALLFVVVSSMFIWGDETASDKGKKTDESKKVAKSNSQLEEYDPSFYEYRSPVDDSEKTKKSEEDKKQKDEEKEASQDKSKDQETENVSKSSEGDSPSTTSSKKTTETESQTGSPDENDEKSSNDNQKEETSKSNEETEEKEESKDTSNEETKADTQTDTTETEKEKTEDDSTEQQSKHDSQEESDDGLSATAQMVQNALPSGYTAVDGGSSVQIHKGGTMIASVNHGGLHLLSLSNGDIQAGISGASALGADSSSLNKVINEALENAGVSSHNSYQAYKSGSNEMIVTYRL